jgi:hypothetical protein
VNVVERERDGDVDGLRIEGDCCCCEIGEGDEIVGFEEERFSIVEDGENCEIG